MRQKEKRQLLILGGLTTIWLLCWIFTRGSPKPVAAPLSPQAGTTPLVSGEALYMGKGVEVKKVKGVGEVKYIGRENRDPLDNSMILEKPKEVVVVEEKKEERVFPKENFSVSAVIWGSKIPQAIINDKIVTVGEVLDGGKIIGIDKKGIHIDFEGREVLLVIK